MLSTLSPIFTTAFMAILFSQSGFDKVLNYQGNQAYLTDYFKNSILAKTVGILMPVITLLEVVAGILCTIGTLWMFFRFDVELGHFLSQIGMLLSTIAILCLFFGQRMAKDYAGAANMTSYFLVALLGLYFLGV
jgi:hypothetical protein